jgi:hypothetical protein
LGTTMSCYHSPAPDARPFATAPYSLTADVRPRPLLVPACCLWAETESGGCEIAVHHRRERKTGPEFALLVLRCRTHRHAFTLYPLGQVPYGRLAVAPVHCDGELVRGAEEDGDSQPGLSWQTTVFVAALQAAKGQAWPRESDGNSRTWDTQQALLEKSAKLLGLLPKTPPRIGEQIAQKLEVPRLKLLDAARIYQGAPGYIERGQAIQGVVQQLIPGRCVLRQLLFCGALCGLWGRVELWEKGAVHARRTVFYEVGTEAVQRRSARAQ